MIARNHHQHQKVSKQEYSFRIYVSPSSSLSDDTGLVPVRSLLSLSSSMSMAPRSYTTSTETNEENTPTGPTASPRDCCTRQHAASTAISNSGRSPSQSPGASYVSMIANGLPSPQSMRESSTEGATVCQAAAHVAQSPALARVLQTDIFPIFFEGNVNIQTNQGMSSRRWQLHSTILARHSSWFAQSIREQKETDTVTAEHKSYVLDKVDGRLTLIPNRSNMERSEKYRLLETVFVKIEDNVEDVGHEAAVEVYDKIFGAFYGIPLHLTPTNIKTATAQAERLMKVAQDLNCVHLVSSHIGNSLLQYRQCLYKAILADPSRYLMLALALENDFIYTESLIHMIGAYPCWPWPTSHSSLPDEMRRLIARKSKELDLQVLEVERELLLLTINTHCGVPYSAEHYSQFDTWFVVQLFRDTLANVLRQHDAAKPSLKRGSLFRKIRAGGSRYMVYEEVRRMMQRIMPSAVDTLDEDLRILKEFASVIVEVLARNELSLDVEEHKVGWLTCAKVGHEDIPWRAGGERDV